MVIYKKIMNDNSYLNENLEPYVVAEIGVNHEGSFDKAIELINLAKKGGANAAKFQTYKAESLASRNSPSYWDTNKEKTKSQFELFKKYDCFEKNDYILLAEHCKKIGIDFLSTPFDDLSVDFLTPLIPFFKIASADITNIPFLRKIARKNKPVILSTGAANLSEIEIAINTIKNINGQIPSLMHCILCYPTDDKNANLSMIKHLKKCFPGSSIGYSDHTIPDNEMTTIVTSYLLGAEIIEKHFTYDKNLSGNDHYHAMDVNDLISLRNNIKKVITLLGNEKYKHPIKEEMISRKNARRSIVTNFDLKSNHLIRERDITYKRPGTGISPLFWDDVVGKKIKKDLPKDYLLKWSDLLD